MIEWLDDAGKPAGFIFNQKLVYGNVKEGWREWQIYIYACVCVRERGEHGVIN